MPNRPTWLGLFGIDPDYPTEGPTKHQVASLAHVQSYNVPADWFTKIDDRLNLSVVAIGENFVWSFTISPNGDIASCEAHLGEFSTGIEV